MSVLPTGLRRRRSALAVAAAAGLSLLLPTAASAHSLESSTVSVHVSEDSVDARISIALETLDEALGTNYSSGVELPAEYADDVTDYLASHVSATGADGTEWAESFSDVSVETVEGITSLSVDVTFDTGASSTSTFTVAYDAIIEAIPTHEAVVVLTDATGAVSTPGVITSTSELLSIGASSATSASSALTDASTGLLDMVGLGLHHVLSGADHLLFLITLLLTAPLVAPLVGLAGRWKPRPGLRPTLHRVLAVITAFTVGHSITLLAASLGWVQVPTTLVEVLVAASVGVAAVHALGPLVHGGEVVIASAFGLVHGLAFAGILSDLGLSGSTSVVALLAFNVGVELAQLAATAMLFPSIYLLAQTRHYPVVRRTGGTLGLMAATGWVAARLGWFDNPLAPLEEAAMSHQWVVVSGLAVVAGLAWMQETSALQRESLGRLGRI